MRQIKRKFVALGTALSLAFVLMAALLPMGEVEANTNTIDSVDVSFTAPKKGVEIKKVEGEYFDPTMPWYDQDPAPGNYMTISGDEVTKGFDGFWVVKPDYQEGTQDDWFFGTLQASQTIYCMVDLNCFESGKKFSENATVNMTGAEIVSKNVNDYGIDMILKVTVAGESGGDDQGGGSDQGGSADQGGDADQGGSSDQTPAASTTTSTVTTLTDGASATIAQADDGTVSFRYEKDFSYFENGGKLYIDGEEVPSDQYTARQGSTIITLLKQYASKLLDGKEHTVKAVFKDGEAIESKITVTPSAAANATAATTTKVTSPKTADVLPIAGIALVFVGATAIGVIAFRRKNS